MRALLTRRGKMEAYYPAYVDSVVLRLYKDGGLSGVLRGFQSKAMPLLARDGMNVQRMSLLSCLLLTLCETGLYAKVYPLILPFQIFGRKIGEADFALRAKKEMPQ